VFRLLHTYLVHCDLIHNGDVALQNFLSLLPLFSAIKCYFTITLLYLSPSYSVMFLAHFQSLSTPLLTYKLPSSARLLFSQLKPSTCSCSFSHSYCNADGVLIPLVTSIISYHIIYFPPVIHTGLHNPHEYGNCHICWD